METIDTEGFKSIQVEILTALDRFCKANGLNYSMACGTLLGAIRHGGFIPWDDDVDVYMLREDFEKLEKSFPSLLDGKYYLATLSRDNSWNRTYGKMCDSRTVFIEDSDTSAQTSVGIDIFPIDEVPQDVSAWRSFNRKRRILQRILLLKGVRYKAERGLTKNLVLLLVKALSSPVSPRRLAMYIDRYIKRYNNSGSPMVFECSQGLLLKRPFNKSLFDQMQPTPFGDNTFMAFKDADAYLKCAYGNYMQLPPVDKQVSHHSYIAHWR